VAPQTAEVTHVSEHAVEERGLLGSFRSIGWAVADGAVRPMDQSFHLTSRE